MPAPEEIIAHLSGLYARYGYEIMFVGAALEALIIINFFIPGALAVAFGAIFARNGTLDLTTVILVASTGAMVGYIIDFFLGYFGFGKIVERFGNQGILAKARSQVESSGVRSISLGFFHPNLGSLVALAAGTLKMKFTRFVILSFLSTLAWVSLWAVLIFSLGEVFLLIITKYMFVVVTLIASIWILVFLYGKSNKYSKGDR